MEGRGKGRTREGRRKGRKDGGRIRERGAEFCGIILKELFINSLWVVNWIWRFEEVLWELYRIWWRNTNASGTFHGRILGMFVFGNLVF